MKKKLIYYFLTLSFILNGCSDSWLEVLPEDRIIPNNFWQNESDVKLALNGLYAGLHERWIYGYGPRLEGLGANGYVWGGGDINCIGNGSNTPSSWGFTERRWEQCYQLIYRCNYFLENIENVELSESVKSVYIGECHFLRGLAYSLLAETYGGVPIIDKIITVEDARKLTRSTAEQTWEKVISEYEIAESKLGVDAPEIGRATKGAALGMKMRAYLNQNKYSEVLKVVNDIDALNKYSLFPSYKGLFLVENENNQEVLFDVQFRAGQEGLGSRFDRGNQPQNLANGVNGASRISATKNLVDAYEMIDGSEVDENDPYTGRDPRLDMTILRPGAYFQGQLYPDEVKSHNGQRNPFLVRKYMIENMPISGKYYESPLNFIVVRYADVLLAKAEALIETQNIDDGIALINRIRTERDDVKLTLIPNGLSQADARKVLRHERRIELAFEALYWVDIRRWNIGNDIYPFSVTDKNGGIIETRFPAGYNERYNLVPIPESEIALNPNLEQNPGW